MDTTTRPVIIERTQQPYRAFRRTVTMRTIPEIADRFPELFAELARRGLEPAGPPFLKYDLFTRSGLLVMEAGVAVFPPDSHGGMDGGPADADLVDLVSGVLPGGRFASLTHLGPPDGLLDATADLLDWGSEQGIRWDTSVDDDGEHWGLRMELYKTDPRVETDLNAWETEIVFRIADPDS